MLVLTPAGKPVLEASTLSAWGRRQDLDEPVDDRHARVFRILRILNVVDVDLDDRLIINGDRGAIAVAYWPEDHTPLGKIPLGHVLSHLPISCSDWSDQRTGQDVAPVGRVADMLHPGRGMVTQV